MPVDIVRKSYTRSDVVPVVGDQTAWNTVSASKTDAIHVERDIRERNPRNSLESWTGRVHSSIAIGNEARLLVRIVKVRVEIRRSIVLIVGMGEGLPTQTEIKRQATINAPVIHRVGINRIEGNVHKILELGLTERVGIPKQEVGSCFFHVQSQAKPKRKLCEPCVQERSSLIWLLRHQFCHGQLPESMERPIGPPLIEIAGILLVGFALAKRGVVLQREGAFHSPVLAIVMSFPFSL